MARAVLYTQTYIYIPSLSWKSARRSIECKKSFSINFPRNVWWSWIWMKWKQQQAFITSFWLFKGNCFHWIIMRNRTTWNYGNWIMLKNNISFIPWMITLRSAVRLLSWEFWKAGCLVLQMILFPSIQRAGTNWIVSVKSE